MLYGDVRVGHILLPVLQDFNQMIPQVAEGICSFLDFLGRLPGVCC